MKIKANHILKALAVAAAVASAPAAMAANGEITFSGAVTSTTCTITGGGGATGTNNMTVKLPTVSVSALSNSGDTAGRTPFSINLAGCTAGATKVATSFEAGNTVDQASGQIKLIDDGSGTPVAENVRIRLLNNTQAAIVAGAPQSAQNSQQVDLAGGAATLQYYAEYVATGTAKAGTASSRIQYSLTYE
ncbi:fimbrial protein [Cupriavidus sp. 30B13]|uniref:fimbrial protein n=1 Tax=Cupriavidus sp. 30B13 TaxID=3384241 RepID=UPI003B91BE31